MLNDHKKVLCIEEHVKHGGLGEKLKYYHQNLILKKIDHYHLKDKFIHFYGSYEKLLSKHGIDKNIILKIMNKKYEKFKSKNLKNLERFRNEIKKVIKTINLMVIYLIFINL